MPAALVNYWRYSQRHLNGIDLCGYLAKLAAGRLMILTYRQVPDSSGSPAGSPARRRVD